MNLFEKINEYIRFFIIKWIYDEVEGIAFQGCFIEESHRNYLYDESLDDLINLSNPQL